MLFIAQIVWPTAAPVDTLSYVLLNTTDFMLVNSLDRLHTVMIFNNVFLFFILGITNILYCCSILHSARNESTVMTYHHICLKFIARSKFDHQSFMSDID